MKRNIRYFLLRLIIPYGFLFAMVLFHSSHTVFAHTYFNIGTTVGDPVSDVSTAVVDVTRVETHIFGVNLNVIFHLRDIPSELDFNKPGVPSGSIEYAWSVRIDVDNNSQTGDDDGCDYVCMVSHVKHSWDVPVTAPIEEVVEGRILFYEYGNLVNSWNTIVAANDISETLAFNANIPGISSSSRFSFSAQAYNVDTGRPEVDLDLNAEVENVDDGGKPLSMPWIPLLLLSDNKPPPPVYTNSLGMTFKLIPAGTFIMGSSSDELGRDSDETQHQVTISQSFYMQTTEVTQEQWEAVMGSNPSWYSSCGSDCPVEYVFWNDVQTFITTLNNMGQGTYRLPTEAEWEYAARAGSTAAFANGNITVTDCGYDPKLDAMGWYCYNSGNMTHPVAQKQPNAWGLYDMHGNVWELCQDLYGDYPSSAVTDPTGPYIGSDRVMRGGSYFNYARHCRSAKRGYDSLIYRYDTIGLRLLRNL